MTRPRILVIRGGAIGDFVLTLPAIRLLRENFPQAHIEILGYKHIIALAERRYYADATRSIEYAALSRFFAPGAELSPELTHYFASFQQIISYLYDPDLFFENNVRRCGVKNFLHVSPKLDDSAHAAQQLAQPLEQLALFLENRAPSLHPSEEDRAAAEQLVPDAAGAPVVALHPGSGSERKNWLVENWRALGDALFARHGRPVRLLLVGGEADRPALARLRDAWKKKPLLFAEDLPLPHLAAALGRCALFIGHDSGIAHIAAAAGAPCVLLFGPTDPDIWAPANPAVTVLRGPDRTLGKLPVEAVLEAVRGHI